VIIGAQKCGTRWLRWNLSKHPEIYAPASEVHFFNNREHFAEGASWYRAQFDGWSGEPIVGEATPGYMIRKHHPEVVAARMHETLPEAKLVAILRNPVDRAVSAMVHFIKYGRLPPDAHLTDVTRRIPPDRDPNGLIAGGYYATSLAPFRELYGDRLAILFHDDALVDPGAVYADAVAHVGATPGFAPPELDEVVWSNPRGRARTELTLEEREEVLAFFSDEIDALERMTGRNLDMWRSASSTPVPRKPR
jgi:hypothetical protein